LIVGILEDPADRGKLADIANRDWGKERIELGAARLKAKGLGGKGARSAARAVYMWVPQGVTSRNWATMLKLREMTKRKGLECHLLRG
jgi:uncharacterized protein (DUF1697 family)